MPDPGAELPARAARELSPARVVTLAAGPMLGLAAAVATRNVLPAPAASALAVAIWMGAWWLTEVIPLGATAILPLVLLPLFGIATPKDAASPYANEIIFLFLGGLLLAAAVERWNMHAHIAYAIVMRIGLAPRRAVLGIVLATAFISMWISNTATAAMMYPIALALASLYGDDEAGRRTRTALMLGVAYAASLGGMGTLIGTPPNLVFAGAAREIAGEPVSFLRFAAIGVPLVIVLVPACWLLLITVFRVPVGEGIPVDIMRERRAALGEVTSGGRRTLLVFSLVAIAWVMREPKDFGAWRLPGLTSLVPGITDMTVAMVGALSLFIVTGRTTAGEQRPLLIWREARAIPWEVLLVTGGGLSLAAAIESSGLAAELGGTLNVLAGFAPIVVFLGIGLIVLLLSEVASNTAVAAMTMPIVAALAPAVGQPAIRLMLVAALAASCGFVLPAATPPNAIVFGSGAVTVRDMARAGIVLDLVGIVAIAIAGATLIPLVLG